MSETQPFWAVIPRTHLLSLVVEGAHHIAARENCQQNNAFHKNLIPL